MLSIVDFPLGKMLINVFLLVLFFMFWFFDMPKTSPWYFIRKKILERPMKWMGFSHGWGMFAPKPINVNRCLRVELILGSGEKYQWPIEDFESLTKWQAVYKGRHRKYQEYLVSKSANILRPAYCDYVIRKYREKFPKGSPVRVVRLYRQVAKIRPPGSRVIASTEYMEELSYQYPPIKKALPKKKAKLAKAL